MKEIKDIDDVIISDEEAKKDVENFIKQIEKEEENYQNNKNEVNFLKYFLNNIF